MVKESAMKTIIGVFCATLACLSAQADGWTGTWHRNSLQDSAEIVITGEEKGKFHFIVTAFSGAHTGEMEGDAVVTGRTAQAVLEDDDVTREAIFTSTITGLRLTTENCEGYFGGAGVVFDGTYVKDAPQAESLALTRLEELLGNKELAAKIKKEMGPALVDMTYCLHVVSEEKCLDSFPATVYVGNVMGVGPEMAAILMVTRKNDFYTAWYDGEKLSYMSSDVRFKKKLPKTIADWVKQYVDVPVIFR
jgi:hypothetical protein